MTDLNLLHRLSDTPVLGVSMAGVSVLRLDLCGGLAPGNKTFKLAENLAEANRLGVKRLLSFGGAWSNHLHALAAVGAEGDIETIGIVRGEVSSTPSAMLVDALDWGMRLEHVSRQDYRRRRDPDYLRGLEQRYGPCLIIPEGGANAAGAAGCSRVAQLLPKTAEFGSVVVLPVGTGTTLAGVASALGQETVVLGISVLKGAYDLNDNVAHLLEKMSPGAAADWRILHDYHCGGYAKVSPGLKAFILAFEAVHQIPLDPVYTGKALYGIHQMLQRGDKLERCVFVHTGGLQGRRGFAW
ncbi:MAG: pyridoxal-phosphate dependent enzyme [Halioglobus sp.]